MGGERKGEGENVEVKREREVRRQKETLSVPLGVLG